MKNQDISQIKKELFESSKKYNIPIIDLQEIFNISMNTSDIKKSFYRLIDNYLIKNIKDEKYKILVEKRLEYLKKLIVKNDDRIPSDKVDMIFNDALDLAIDLYSPGKDLDKLVYTSMKRLLSTYNYNYDSKISNIHSNLSNVDTRPLYRSPESLLTKKIKVENKPKQELIQEENTELIDSNNRINLSFLKILLTCDVMDNGELINYIQINPKSLYDVLSGKLHLSEKHLTKLYKRYKVDNVYDLKAKLESLVKNDTQTTIKDDESIKKSAKLIEKFLSIYALSIYDFSKKIDIPLHILATFILDKIEISIDNMNKLYAYFNVSNIYQLIEKLEDEFKNYPDMEIYKLQDLLYNYLRMNYMSLKSFEENTNIPTELLSNFVLKKCILPMEYFKKLCEYFQVRDIPNLIKKLEEITEDYIKLPLLLKKYIKMYYDNAKQFAQKIGLHHQILYNYFSSKYNLPIYALNALYDHLDIKQKNISALVSKLEVETENYNNEKMNEIPLLLSKFLKFKNFSIDFFSTQVNINKSSLYNYITGKTTLSSKNLKKLYQYFGLKNEYEFVEFLKNEIKTEEQSQEKLESKKLKYLDKKIVN